MRKRPLPELAAGLAGFVFGIGLIVSGMFNPAKVLAFLDLAGRWDPSLALVMVGAIATAAVGFTIADRRGNTLLGGSFHLSSARDIDRRLVLGSMAFGAGWGLVGFCPGPALVAIGAGEIKAVVFAASMVVGMLAFEGMERWRKPEPESVAPDRTQSAAADG
jgi:uncharacterized membrane protein YedE/YeeE